MKTKAVIIATIVIIITMVATYLFGLRSNENDFKTSTPKTNTSLLELQRNIPIEEKMTLPLRKPILEGQQLASHLASPKKIKPDEKELIEDSLFYDVGFVNAELLYGIKGFSPIAEDYETLLNYGLLQGDIIVAVNGKEVPESLGSFVNQLTDLYSNPQNFFEESIIFTINRNQDVFDLEIAID